MRNMIKKSLSKKFIIKGVATTLVVLLPFSFKPQETKAIVGVDDAILFTILGLGAVTSIGAIYGMEKNGVFKKTGEFLGDELQDIGNGWKTVENSLAFAKSTIAMLPDILNSFESLEGTEVEEQEIIEGTTIPVLIPSTLTDEGSESTLKYLMTFNPTSNEQYTISFLNNQNFTYTEPVHLYTISAVNGSSLQGFNKFYLSTNLENMSTEGGYFQLNMLSDKCQPIDSNYPTNSTINITTSNCFVTSSKTFIFPSVHDVTDKPTSISLDKAQIESIAQDYAEKYPNDNNGDKNVDYNTLIPFFFDMLEKKLGDGTITPTTLANNGFSSYVYESGQAEGLYPYNFQELGENNINVEQNVVVNNSSEVSEEEKNGILNILDNGIKKTTTLLNNLKDSMSDLGNTLKGLFDLLPEPVGYLFYSALCLSLVFFILSLRR